MKVKRITRDMIRSLEVLEVGEYELPTARACETARMQVSHVKRVDGGEFKCHVDYQKKQVRILRIS